MAFQDHRTSPTPRSVAILPTLDLLRKLQPHREQPNLGLTGFKPQVAGHLTKDRPNIIGGTT